MGKKTGCKSSEILSGGVCIPKQCLKFRDYFPEGDVGLSDRYFLLPDGSMVDTSGYDHCDIGRPFTSQSGWKKTHVTNKDKIMMALMKKCRLMRVWIYDGEVEVNSFNKPTEAQINRLVAELSQNDGFHGVRLTDNMGSKCEHKPFIAKLFDVGKWAEKCW